MKKKKKKKKKKRLLLAESYQDLTKNKKENIDSDLTKQNKMKNILWFPEIEIEIMSMPLGT